MKCPSCDQRKGKRNCPGLRQTICSTCCGEKRIVKIPCPADCSYLVSGREYQGSRHYANQMSGPDGALFEKVLNDSQNLFMDMQHVLVEVQRVIRSFNDQKALEAVQAVRRTCETEQKGVIYEYQSPNPQVQVAVKDLMNRITQLRQHQDPHEHAKLGDIINCLQVLEKDISSVIQRNQAPDAYLTFISAFYPDEKKTISSIILP